MPEETNRERLQPCLLDRLTNDTPGTTVESRDKRVMTPAQIRQSVLRDLSWLMNCSAPLDSTESGRAEAEQFPSVHQSVVNFGIADFTGQTASGISARDMEKRMVEAILRFEPRVMRRGLVVRALVDEGAFSHNAITFEIQGQIWAQPLPERLDVRTEVDLETGQVTIVERTTSPGAKVNPSARESSGPPAPPSPPPGQHSARGPRG